MNTVNLNLQHLSLNAISDLALALLSEIECDSRARAEFLPALDTIVREYERRGQVVHQRALLNSIDAVTPLDVDALQVSGYVQQAHNRARGV